MSDIDREVKYLISLCNSVTDDIYEEILYYFETNHSANTNGHQQNFSNKIYNFIKTNIGQNPAIILQIIDKLKRSNLYNEEANGKNIERIILEEITAISTSLKECVLNNKKKKINSLLTLISEYPWDFKNHDEKTKNNFISDIYQLTTLGYSKELYLSLLSHNSNNVIEAITKFEGDKVTSMSWPMNPDVMVDLCFSSKKHWLIELINHFSTLLEKDDIPLYSDTVIKKLWQVVLINFMNNTSHVDLITILDRLKTYFSFIEIQNTEESLHIYFNEIYREINLIIFCMNNSKRKLLFSWNDMLQNHSALSIISQTCDLSELDWFKVKQALIMNSDLLMKMECNKVKHDEFKQWDVMTYNAYCIITSIINIISLNSNNTSLNQHSMLSNIEEIKVMISNLYPLKYRIEILKNIFACLFLRFEYFSTEEEKLSQDCTSHSDCSYFIMRNEDYGKLFTDCRGFICRQELAKEILSLLKECITDIRENKLTININLNQDNKLKTMQDDFDMEDFKLFENYICNAMWRWELISSLKIEQSEMACSQNFYNNIVDSSSGDENETVAIARRKKTRFRKRRSKSYNENLFSYSKDNKNKDMKQSVSNDPDFISMMLSTPNSLLALCLETNNFSKAHKIIEIYDLSDTEAYMEVVFTQQFLPLVDRIKNSTLFSNASTNLNQMEIMTGMSVVSTSVVSLVESFLSTLRPSYNYQLTDLVQTFPQLQMYENTNSSIVTIIDLLLSTGIDRNVTYGVLNVAENRSQEIEIHTDLESKQQNFITFIRNIINILYEIYNNSSLIDENRGICDILSEDKTPIKYKDYLQSVENLNRISKYHADFSTSIKNVPQDTCSTFIESLSKQKKIFLNPALGNEMDAESEKSDNSYLKNFISYVKHISQLKNDGLESSVESIETPLDDDILNSPLHDLIGKLIHLNAVSVDTIEPICKKLGINLIHKLVLNYCPPIKCQEIFDSDESFNALLDIIDEEKSENESDEPDVNTKHIFIKPNQDIVTYILIHNWVVANLLKKIHSDSSEYILQQSMDNRTKFLDSYLQEKRFDVLKEMYYDNKPLTALQTIYDSNILHSYLKKFLVSGNLSGCLNVLDALPERMLHADLMISLRNKILLNLAVKPGEILNWVNFLSITDIDLQCSNVLQNLTHWSYDGTIEILKYFIYHNTMEDDMFKNECKKWLDCMPVYLKIAQLTVDNTWTSIYSLSCEDTEAVLQLLIDAQQFELCLRWTNLHEVSSNMRNLIIHNLLKQSLHTSTDLSLIDLGGLLLDIPMQQSIDLCKEMLVKIRDIDALKTIVKFLMQTSQDSSQFENICIGIELLSEIELTEKPLFWDLISKPLLIIEQYLMNAKLDKLAKLLHKIRPMLKLNHLGDNLYYNISLIDTSMISTNTVDALLRIYAGKALDLRSSKNSRLSLNKKPEEMLLQSIDSINLVGGSNVFEMPEEVPNKENWVPDDSTERCMACKTTIFSILIRRHHCRRCGRLVCYTCSRHRMQIPGLYSDIKVRVCDDCYTQTMSKSENLEYRSMIHPGSGSVHSECPSLEWCLSKDSRYNDELRKEFIYEFSPNVNLCLSIMKMHSINLDYPRFLLDRSSELSRAAGNTDDGVLELVRMRRALLLSCVELYSRPLPLIATKIIDNALAHTVRQLAITDALAHLATHGCQSMMPEVDFLDTHYVRRLLKAEKWELALEISTKFGMARTGVLAAWGKACLRSGSFNQARQKFSLCFKNTSVSTVDNADSVKEISLSKNPIRKLRRSDLNVSSSQLDLYRSKSNPALLDEIIELLECTNYSINPQIMKKAETIKNQYENFSSLHKTSKKMKTTEPALNIMHALASVQKIKQGDFSDFSTASQYAKKSKQTIILKKQNQNEKKDLKPKLDPFFYNECIYYLTSYGSHIAIINFYLKYNNLIEALQHCCEHSVDKDIFTENIFMCYLKSDKLKDLLNVMCDIDSTWKIWTDYLLHACRVLEHRGWLEPLHTVQTHIDDFVRAAITCAELYTRPTQAPHAAALHARDHHLAQARFHLQKAPRRSNHDVPQSPTKCLHLKMDNASLEKHIGTLYRQTEVVTFLYVCEMSGRLTEEMVCDIMPGMSDTAETRGNECFLPTLFGTNLEKIKLAVLVLICGVDVKEGFGIVHRIIKDHGLDAMKVFSLTVRYLVNKDRYDEIQHLCDYIKKYCDDTSRNISDGVIEVGVAAIVRKCDAKGQLFDELAELLIAKTENISVKISCYIECRILKTAYQLAVQNNRPPSDLRKIMREAERLGQTNVRNACLKRLSILNNS